MSDTVVAASAKRKKRAYLEHKGKKQQYNPKRGSPGVLLTAETGREYKCQTEGLDILTHYYSLQAEDDVSKGSDSQKQPLSLDDELKMLRSKQSKSHHHPHFAVYETGCRGTVFVLCTTPGCNLIPPISVEGNEKSKTKESGNEEDGSEHHDLDGAEKKKARLDEQKPSSEDSESKPKPAEKEDTAVKKLWDPIETVRNVLEDLEKGSKQMPRSRFVTRMIPIQATCFASIEEIQLTAKALVTKYLPPDAQTFAIAFKRRNCGNVTREQVIDTIAKIVLASNPKCKVNLDKPDLTIVVEICKTLCGISVVPNSYDFHNFNLVCARESKVGNDKKGGEDAGKQKKATKEE